MPTRTSLFILTSALLMPMLLGSCASPASNRSELQKARIDQCKSGDTEVAEQNQCLQDDAACYAISSGRYCTGTRASICPDGSTALGVDDGCPNGKRCFQLSESLKCVAD